METANTLTYDGVLQLAGEFANASPERQQQIRGTLGQWRQADRLRQEQELAAQQESVDRFFLGQFTNDQEFQQSADHPAVHLAESHSDDPGQVKYTALGQSYLSSLLGRDVTGFEYQYQRDGYSLARFGRKPANDREFRDMVAGELRTNQARKTAWEDLQGQVVVNALRDAAEGRETLLAPTFQKWTETHRDLVDEESETGFLTQSLKFQKAILGDMQRLRVPAANVWRTLTAFSEGKATDEDVLTLGRDLSGLSREDRQKIYGYSALAAAASGIDRSTFEQFAKNLGESVSRSFDFIGKGNLTSQEDGVRLWLNELRRGNVQMGESGNPRFAAPGQPGTRPLTEDERAALEKRFSETLPMFQVARELKAVAREQIDPIKPIFAANTGLGLAEQGLYGLAGSTGFLAASAIPYTFGIGGFMAYQAEEEDRIRVENPDINPQTAKALSIAEAAGNVLLDRMQLKRLPVLAGLAREVRVTGWGRAARKAGLVWGEQTAQELAQNAIAPVFETIASAMRSDMTPRDAGQEFSRYIEDIPATLAATGWLALIGGGFASVRDIKNPQADVDVALRHWGFSAEQSRRIKAAATPEAFDEAVREEMPRRTPENIASGRREAKTAWQRAEQQQADSAQPKLEAITRGERGTEWIVRDSQGRETLRTPNSETAQLALAELQQSAARRRGAGDAAEANIPESRENLNQLRMSKGRQEPHRLAQPINTRYLSHDEQLRDPAHVLQSTLRKSGGAVEGQQGKHGRRLASDSSLFAWADEHRGSYHRNPQDFAKLESGGSEHAIFRDRETGRLVKLTKPGLFGAQAEDAGAYLERLALSNRVFGDDVRFEGIVTLPGEHAPRVVTSQSFVEGRDATAAEQAEYLRSKGFVEHDGRWVHPVLGVAVWDTQTPGNVITRPDGTMQAVDLQVEKARPEELRAVRQQSGLGLPTVFSKSGVDHVDNGDRYAIAPAGYGIRRLTARDVPQPVKADSDPFTHVPEGSGLSAWGRAWSSWLKTHKQSWKRPEPIPTSDGPILISTKTEKEMERVAVKEDAHLHYIAATKLPDLIEHSVLKSVERESKGKPDVAEVHRRYAWMDFPDGKRRSVLLTIFRWDAKIDRDFDTAYSEQVVLEVKSEPLGGSSKRGDKHIELAPSGRETLAQFLSGIKPEHLSDREGSGVTREQARQWVDEVLRKWGSQLGVTVHESAEAIPDAAMRDEVLREGDVDAFFNGSDGKIHLLADRVNSLSDAERLLKHEGFHWAVGGKLRVEYGQLVAAIGRKIPSDRMQKIIARYPKGTPELWVEEYLAHLAETNPESPVWRQFVYEVKRLLRRVFGDRIEYTEQDIQAFLSKAQQRAKRARAADAAEFAKAQQELRFAKNKPKGPQRRSWEEVRKGDRWNSVKKWLPKENVEPTFFPAHGTQEEVVERAYQFIKNNPIVTDWTGRLVYLPYEQSKGQYKDDPIRNRAEHVVAYDLKQGTHQRILHREKAKWLATTLETIRNGRVRVREDSSVLYFRKYGNTTHMVVTSAEGVFLKQAAYDSGLVTQYPVHLKDEDFEEAFVEEINPAPIK